MKSIAVYGPNVSHMYNVIVEGRKRELQNLTVDENMISDIIADFAQVVKFIKRVDFNELYDFYKDTVVPISISMRFKKEAE